MNLPIPSAAAPQVLAVAPAYLDPKDACRYLGISVNDLRALVDEDQLPAYRIRSQVVFRSSDLDSVVQRLSPSEASKQLGPIISRVCESDEVAPAERAGPTNPLVPLREAAATLGFPYKTLLRLANEGAIPATNINEHRGHRRPRFMLDVQVVKSALDRIGQKQTAARSAPAQADLGLAGLLRAGAQ